MPDKMRIGIKDFRFPAESESGKENRDSKKRLLTILRVLNKPHAVTQPASSTSTQSLAEINIPKISMQTLRLSQRRLAVLGSSLLLFTPSLRSEERRVGKECISRWSRGDYK